MRKWLRKSCWTIWEGILKHLVVIIIAFVCSGGYLIAINKLKEFQYWVRDIPTDYVLTPLVLLIIILIVILRINYKQHQQLSKIKSQPHGDNEESRYVTHLGVWWKIYMDSEYIEDFPYCPCCEPKQKLVQVEWYPNEVYKCPKTETEIRLFDDFPLKRERVLQKLYRLYFGGVRLEQTLFAELGRIRRLHPEKQEIEILKEIFDREPFNRIPKNKVQEVFDRFSSPRQIIHFFSDHAKAYKKYLRKDNNKEK